ncbi:hypothetical protein CXP39_00900 [Mesoplasma syrphidae]|uniref:tRNA-binding domain-containing protein n=1 Tax=Mesoplasma syrphidae TaxID=225999 RepID=A0A2K9BMU4_9MOLU|nr:hypothetical protein [Mesoplasma syrphidae]AUF83363.1 hypothetical protein CXP39_00900 [Mesoplasma syrphidae]
MQKLKYGIYYNQQFNALMSNFNNDRSITEIVELDNLTVLKHGNEIVAINIFNPDLDIKQGFVSEDKRVYSYVQKVIENLIAVEQDVQFKIGKVLSCELILGTHLNLCQVDLGAETLQIVCGAANVRNDLLVVVATPGSYLPNGLKIGENKLHGFDSYGMLCSARELEIPFGIYNSEGIIELDNKFANKLGESFWGIHYEYNN